MLPPSVQPNNIQFRRQPSLTHRIDGYNVRGKVDGLDALNQSLTRRILTARYMHPNTYGPDEGTELPISESFEYIQATIENTLQDSLLQDDRVSDVMVRSVTRIGLETALIDVDVISVLGVVNLSLEVPYTA